MLKALSKFEKFLSMPLCLSGIFEKSTKLKMSRLVEINFNDSTISKGSVLQKSNCLDESFKSRGCVLVNLWKRNEM